MDVDGLVKLLARIEPGESACLPRSDHPSPLSMAIINARPYPFLDDGTRGPPHALPCARSAG